MIMTLYVKGKSKKAINETLAAGQPVIGENYSIFGGGGSYNLQDLQEEAIIKIFEKYVDDNPYAKAYGKYNPQKKRIT